MTITSQQYAYLADHSYGRDERGNTVDLKALEGKVAVIGGVKYEVLAYVDRPSGYQGAVYQRVDTGEVIVAHRGTEFDRQRWLDLVKTDGLMAFSRFNPQADDAIALTGVAVAEAQKYALATGGNPPAITHTGHSLGGTLAQISGHYFGHGGETFNAYGAASLNVRNPATGEFYRIAAGGDAFLNHVMGADLVSAASPHYGQERRYTNQREIDTLQGYGYENNRGFDLRFEGAAVAAMTGGSHDMHNFLPWNGDNNRDVAVLSDPDARRMATQFDPMLDKFRGDVTALRKMAGALGTSPRDIIEAFQQPLEGGEPARRAAQQPRDRRGAFLDAEDAAPLPDMRDGNHPANEKYRQAYAGVTEIDRSLGRIPDGASERLAASLTAAGAGLPSIRAVVLSPDGSRAFALDGASVAPTRVHVEVAAAVARPVEASTQDWQAVSQQLALESVRQHVHEREQAQIAVRSTALS